ncbi:L,D-transpeptidase [Myxococcota bacterium]|nr:L,D-transpeptidase [Myxococcota bacterium]MBU1379751.1 L,D-transpeptidase [Myxococcota bacterium]MBU1498536.1 L,D-transpeptidase [Myxococcota bacterium]
MLFLFLFNLSLSHELLFNGFECAVSSESGTATEKPGNREIAGTIKPDFCIPILKKTDKSCTNGYFWIVSGSYSICSSGFKSRAVNFREFFHKILAPHPLFKVNHRKAIRECYGYESTKHAKENKRGYLYPKNTYFAPNGQYGRVFNKWYFLNSQDILIDPSCTSVGNYYDFKGKNFIDSKSLKLNHAWVYGMKGTPVYDGFLNPTGKRIKHHEALRVYSRVFKEKNGIRYIKSEMGFYIPETHLRIATISPAPSFLKSTSEKWIEVNKSQQTMVAYEGNNPVFATLVSTARKGHETYPGVYRIFYKRVSQDISSRIGKKYTSRYENVPWIQFFDGDRAIHSSFWHNEFGSRNSRGCVEMSLSDSHFLFNWTTPHVPMGFYKMNQSAASPGTYIRIVDYQGQKVPFRSNVFSE